MNHKLDKGYNMTFPAKNNETLLIRKDCIFLHGFFSSISFSLFKISGESCHLNCNTLEQTLNRLGLQQYLDVLQKENLDLESLVRHNEYTH